MGTVKLPHKRKAKSTNKDQEGCRLGLKPAPDEILKRASGKDK
jgi:hypothetical protein